MIILPTLLIFGVVHLIGCVPESPEKHNTPGNVALGLRSFSAAAGAERNPILEYLLSPSYSRNQIPPGGKREFTFLQTFPTSSPPSKKKPIIVTAPPKTKPFQRDPNKSPYENFTGYIMAGRKPEDNLVESQSVTISDKADKSASDNRTQVIVYPAIATVINSYDEKGTLRSSYTRYEPAGSPSNTAESAQTRQQITWPYAGYFPILIKDPFLTAFHTLAAGNSFSLSSLVEYGAAADVCATKRQEAVDEYKDVIKDRNTGHLRTVRDVKDDGYPEQYWPVNHFYQNWRNDRSRASKMTRVTVSDPNKGLASIRIRNPDNDSDEPKLTVRKGGVSIAGPGGFATAYTGGTAVVGPYGTVFKSPEGVAIAGPHSNIINITDSTSFAEILRMYEAVKANNSMAGRSLVSADKQVEIDNTEETNIGGEYTQVNKLFSFKSSQPPMLISEGGLQKARKTSRTIIRSSGREQLGSNEWPTFRAASSNEFFTNGMEPKEQDPQQQKQFWQRLISETRENLQAQKGETTLIFAPKTKAEAGKDGIAVSSPVSYAEVHPGQDAHLVFQPEASALAGPGGFAHAHSDLFVRYLKRRTKPGGYN